MKKGEWGGEEAARVKRVREEKEPKTQDKYQTIKCSCCVSACTDYDKYPDYSPVRYIHTKYLR